MVTTGRHRKIHTMDSPQTSTMVLSQAHIPFSGLKNSPKIALPFYQAGRRPRAYTHFWVSALPTDWRLASARSGSRRTNSLRRTSTT